MSKATEGGGRKLCSARGEERYKHTWFDVTNGLLGASNVTTGEGFWMPFANVLSGLLRGSVSLDDACSNSEVGRLLCDGLAKASTLPLG